MLPTDLVARLLDPLARLILVHNHTQGTGLSRADLRIRTAHETARAPDGRPLSPSEEFEPQRRDHRSGELHRPSSR
jgi:hypothetical protein